MRAKARPPAAFAIVELNPPLSFIVKWLQLH
jgi:hypothetical protein